MSETQYGETFLSNTINSFSITQHDTYATVHLTGVVQIGGAQNRVWYRIYDQDGYVVEESLISIDATQDGAKFKADGNCYFNFVDLSGNYTIEFFDRNI